MTRAHRHPPLDDGTSAGPGFRTFLLPLSALFGAAVYLRTRACDAGWRKVERAARPVISVGNLSVGGSGKTPLVRDIVERALAHGLRPAVISRGYGRGTRGTVIVGDGAGSVCSAREGGDEPVQLARAHPELVVIADERRARGCRIAVDRFGADLLVLDDGFQHRGCARDLDIVAVDASRPGGDWRLLPAGRLREPVTALGRAGLVVLTRCDDAARARRLGAWLGMHTGAPTVHSRFIVARLDVVSPVTDGTGAQVPVDDDPAPLRGRRVAAFCGIGHPASFQHILTGLGAAIVVFRAFPDHHDYRDGDLRSVLADARAAGVDAVVTTEKDAARLHGRFGVFGALPVLAPRLALDLGEGGDAYVDALERIFARCRT